MPAISMFYGIVIYMYFFDNVRHKVPHIHAKYQSTESVFSILDGNILVGDLPNSQCRLVQAWIEIHKDSLMADWSLAVEGKSVFPIDPLK